MPPRSIIWDVPPKLAIPENPALLADGETLWLAYWAVWKDAKGLCAVVRFEGVIDHRLSPINDEGLGEHPYATAGLTWYEFNELLESHEAKRWQTLGARHWVVTFKDVTLDVVARSGVVVSERLPARTATAALLAVMDESP